MEVPTRKESKRLAKNTMFMYIRMIVLTLITLYTSRVILNQLGVEDYGIYNLVGSVVMMFNSLRSVFASSTQRYLSYEIGRKNLGKLTEIFNVSLQLNGIISIVFVLLAEIVGLWFINNKINVSAEKIMAVHYVLQFSIVGAVFSIFTTSFDAVVIAHERMSFYAYLSIFEALIKLLICYVLSYSSNKLLFYGFLMMMTASVVFFINMIFCRLQFEEIRLRRIHKSYYFSKMSSFAGWNFLGNSAYALSQNGMNMILNVFGGPVVNAARGISYQVNQALFQFSNSMAVVFKPYTIKTYAEGNMRKAFKLTFLTSKLFFIIQLYLVAIFSFYLNDIIFLWLGQTPFYVHDFLLILLWHSLVRSLHNPIDILFYAVGRLKYYQICEGLCLSLSVLLAYLLLINGLPYYSAFYALLFSEIVNLALILLLANKICNLNLRLYYRKVLVPISLCFFMYFSATYIKESYEIIGFMRVFALLFFTISICTLIIYFIGFDMDERETFLSMLKISKNGKNTQN